MTMPRRGVSANIGNITQPETSPNPKELNTQPSLSVPDRALNTRSSPQYPIEPSVPDRALNTESNHVYFDAPAYPHTPD
jgi:hypothetical protein